MMHTIFELSTFIKVRASALSATAALLLAANPVLHTGCSEQPAAGNGARETRVEEEVTATPVPARGRIASPNDGHAFIIGDDIAIDVEFDDDPVGIAEVTMVVDGRDTEFEGNISGTITWDSGDWPTGTRRIRISVVYEDGSRENLQLRVVLYSDISPVRYTYRIVNSYQHDIRAFTQGLVYHEGYLYESTGQYGRSTLRKVRLETGEVLRSLNLDRQLFGEGLTVLNGKLYQLTWQSRVGFIYDLESFRLLNRVHYETEGWGLTNDGINLLKSDGSHYIYILDPQYFSETGRIEVYDNNGRVDGLNELQYIDGIIYANVFATDEIVMIEATSGRVTGVIDLTGLLDRRYHHPNLDVLNGVAWDSENDRLFVTGKNWPRLFEIELTRM